MKFLEIFAICLFCLAVNGQLIASVISRGEYARTFYDFSNAFYRTYPPSMRPIYKNTSNYSTVQVNFNSFYPSTYQNSDISVVFDARSQSIEVSGGYATWKSSFNMNMWGNGSYYGYGDVTVKVLNFFLIKKWNNYTRSFTADFVTLQLAPLSVENLSPYSWEAYQILNQSLADPDVFYELRNNLTREYKNMLNSIYNSSGSPNSSNYTNTTSSYCYEWYKCLYFNNNPMGFEIGNSFIVNFTDGRLENVYPYPYYSKYISKDDIDVNTYGGNQNIMSWSLINNSIVAALNKGYFDANFSEYNWENPYFMFYAGELQNYIPDILKYFSPYAKIEGSCNASRYSFYVFSFFPISLSAS